MTEEKRNTSSPSEEASTTSKQPVMQRDAETTPKPTASSNQVAEKEPTTRSQRNAKDEKVEGALKKERRSKRNEKEPEAEQKEDAKPVRWVQIRILPIYVRVLIVLVLLVLAIIVGAYIGYSILGDGAAKDIFQKETWTHIIDIMNGTQ